MNKPQHSTSSGSVALVGAGPGAPDLLTLRALREIEAADVVLHDRLVPAAIVDLCAHARCINVGKSPDGEKTSQDVINRLLLKEARNGHRVVRLKGGDPFVFGRGSEEAIFLRANGVDNVRIVPGLTSSVTGPLSGCIPVTHRRMSTHFSVVTGRGSIGTDADVEATWAQLVSAGGTVVFLMSVRKLPRIAEVLLEAGINPKLPVGIVESATREEQRVTVGTLANIVGRAHDAGVKSPAVIVVGEVVKLREQLIAAASDASSEKPYAAATGSGYQATF